MSRLRLWTKEEEQALLELHKIYGINRPSDIAHQLKTIYGIKKKPTQISSHFPRIDPSINRTKLNDQEKNRIWELYKVHGNKWGMIASLLNRQNEMHAKYLRIINRIFGQKKQQNRTKLRYLKQQTFYHLLDLSKDDNQNDDELYKQVKKSSIKFIQIMDSLFEKKSENEDDIFKLLNPMTNKNEIQTILEHIFLLNTMQNISLNLILPKDSKKDDLSLLYFYDVRMRHQKIIQTWEQAEQMTSVHDSKLNLQQQFELTKEEIDLIKESPLYKRLFRNPHKIFLNLYNEAVKSFQDNKKYTLMIEENSKKTSQVQKELKTNNKQKNQGEGIPFWKKLRSQRDIHEDPLSTKFREDFLKIMEDDEQL